PSPSWWSCRASRRPPPPTHRRRPDLGRRPAVPPESPARVLAPAPGDPQLLRRWPPTLEHRLRARGRGPAIFPPPGLPNRLLLRGRYHNLLSRRLAAWRGAPSRSSLLRRSP